MPINALPESTFAASWVKPLWPVLIIWAVLGILYLWRSRKKT
jgi:hypothetical protein